jgi:tripartite-type tricarboxylate transporter receptor subunit TctC
MKPTAPLLRSLLALTFVLTAAVAGAQEYPTRPVTLVVPFPPGGSTDVQARLIAKGLSERIGQPVVVDNKPGAAGAIGTRFVAASEGDGHTLLFASISSLVTEPVLNEKAGFDPLRDFAPISIVTDMPFLLVVDCARGAKTVDELMAQARAKPGKLNYSSWGYGSAGNLLAEMFKLNTKLSVVHIPYKGEAPAVLGLMSGDVDMMFVTPVNMPHINNKKLCPLAVTGTSRLQVLPNVPTFAEAGIKGMEFQIWFGVVAPAKTPAAVVEKLQREVAAVTGSAEFGRAATAQGVMTVGSDSKVFSQRIRSDQAMISDLSKSARIKE